MMNKKFKSFSNFDVFVITRELNEILSNSTIINVYEVEDLLILKINTNNGRRNLIIKKDSRINLTEYDYPIPKYPSQYIISLRKFLKNRQIKSISQYNFDRIILIELKSIESEPWKFIIELFNKGNYLLIDDKNILKVAKRYRKLKDRDLLAGQEFKFPQARGKNFLTLNEKEFIELVKESNSEIVRVLARNINIAGLYSEEICFRSKLDKTLITKDLTDGDLHSLFKNLKHLRNELLFGTINPNVIIDDTGAELAVVPFNLEIFNKYEKLHFDNFNKAVDYFFSKIDYNEITVPKDEEITKKIKAFEKILRNQTTYLEELRLKKENYYTYGDFIYANFKSLENLLSVISQAKSKGYSWEEINNKLSNAKLEKLEGTEFFNKIIPATKQIVITFDDDEIYLDLDKSIGENANQIYLKGKKS
ncbi:MAG: NFACT family protein, partial [Candidatus Hermodarchaeota archaeon]